jgi:tRNA G18 (ribose-2'-O)-methylase SpoU
LNNIGSVFRSSDAFLIQKIYLCGITAQPPHKDIHKTALGSTDSVAWEYVENTLELVEKLKQDGVEVWSIEQAEKSIFLNDFQPKKNQVHAFVLGNEIKGVDQEVVNASQGVIEIPQEGAKHSLNIAVTAGVVAWDYFQKINQA